LTLSPTLKVLSTLRTHRVRALLMGGQACVLYGAAEFSRDVDVAVLASESNLEHLRLALADLCAEPVFVPPLGAEVLERGHACHYRAGISEADGIRIDIMSVMRGCDPFSELWRRRRKVSIPGFGRLNVLALPDLVQAKKTQRDKDWPMIRRLIEVDFQAHSSKRPSRSQIEFWLRQARTPDLLLELCRRYPGAAGRVASERAAVRRALLGESEEIMGALREEELALRSADQAYWRPLRAELFQWRQELRKRR
jgi:hypothetical protein